MEHRHARRPWGRHEHWRELSPEDEKQALIHQQSWLKARLEQVTHRIEEINKGTGEASE